MMCSVRDCGSTAHCRRLCRKHYYRWYRHGDPTVNLRDPALALDVLRAAMQSSDCTTVPFTTVTLNGERHRAYVGACILANGACPPGKHQVAHSCGSGPHCVTAAHLRWATISENQLDRRLHGTDNTGERNGMAKLSDVQRTAIRSDPRPAPLVAAEHGISVKYVRKLRS